MIAGVSIWCIVVDKIIGKLRMICVYGNTRVGLGLVCERAEYAMGSHWEFESSHMNNITTMKYENRKPTTLCAIQFICLYSDHLKFEI